ncbi:MAG: 4'-phosphopantetheinyl transferase superfamily protein [Planctomycetales bacterium]
MNRPDLAVGDIDLWYTYIGDATPQLLQQYYQLLDEQEKSRLARLRLERVRNEYLVTRALIRSVLSRYADVDPKAWSFSQSNHGKPIVKAPWAGYQSFNISHSAGVVVCAVAAEGDLGIDIESINRKTTGVPIARRFFSTHEVGTLVAAGPSRQQEVFIQIWTLKESYIKAVGHGLTIPLDSFFLAFRTDGPPQLYLSSAPDQPLNDWQFVQLRLGGQHHIALATVGPIARNLYLKVKQLVPLGESPIEKPTRYDLDNRWFVVD